MTTEKTIKYYLSEDDKEILEKAREILQTFDEDPEDMLRHTTEFEYLYRDEDFSNAVSTIDEILFNENVNLTLN